MRGRLARLAAVVRADVLIRFRRPSTAVVFVLLSALPYLWIPEPSTGRALMQIGGKRALYNSAAIGMATATIAALFIGLFGFYVISNALRRDVLSRCGFVIASTTMRGSEYLLGKFAGNVAFLALFTAGFMVVSMAMVLLRGEAPLQPLLFMKQYALLLPSVITFVSAVAVFFEATPMLRSRVGDVLYFFLWIGSFGMVASMLGDGAADWVLLFDASGLGFVFHQMKVIYGTESMTIGMSAIDPAKGTIDFAGLSGAPYWLLLRSGATLWPIALIAIARPFFHRFDPARLKAVSAAGGTGWIARLEHFVKPPARVLVALFQQIGSAFAPTRSLLQATVAEASAALAASPLVAIAVVGFAIASLVTPAAGLRQGLIPAIYVGIALASAGVACREQRSGTSALVFAMPRLRTLFVVWKFGASVVLALCFLALPLARLALHDPSAIPALLVGATFVAAAATAFGLMSGNPKTFLVLFLTFWYVALSDDGAALDFGGWSGRATPAITATYAGMALLLLVAAQLFHQVRLRSRW